MGLRDNPNVGIVLNNMGTALATRGGHSREALMMFKSALRASHRAFGAMGAVGVVAFAASAAIVLINVANVYEQDRRTLEAMRMFTLGVSILRRARVSNEGQSQEIVQQLLYGRARTLAELGEDTAALNTFTVLLRLLQL